METEYETEIDDSRGIIYLHGDLDNETAGEALRRAFNKVFDRGLRTVILDMSDVDIINSFGIGKILVCQKRMTAEEGSLKVRPLKGFVREVFELLMLDLIIPISSEEDESDGEIDVNDAELDQMGLDESDLELDDDDDL